MEERRPSPRLVGLAIGVFATALQIAIMRELLGLWGGNELVVAVGLAMWLLGLSACALLGARVPPARSFRVAAALAGPLSVGLVLAARLGLELWRLPVGATAGPLPLLGLVALSAAPAGGLAGFLFTTAARSLSAKMESAAAVYEAEAIGALLGGLAFAGLLAGRVPHLVMGAAAAGPLLLIATMGRRSSSRVAPLLAAGLAWAGLLAAAQALETWSTARAFRALAGSGQLVAAVETPYGRLAVGERLAQSTVYLDNQAIDTFPEPYDKPMPVHLALLQHPRPRSLLVIGALPADRAPAALAHGLERLVFVYLDAQALRWLSPLLPRATKRALADPRVSVVAADGRAYLTRSRERFDVVLVHTGAPRSLSAARYHTVEAFSSAAAVLAEGGSFTVSTAGAASRLSKAAAAAAAAEHRGLKKAFRHVAVVPGTSLLFHASQSREAATTDAAVLRRRLDTRARSAVVEPSLIEDLYDPRRAAAFLRDIEASPAVVASDRRPTAHLWALSQWTHEWHGATARGTSLWAALLLFGLVGLVLWGAARGQGVGQGRLSRPLVGVASTGLAGMALQIAALFVYQIGSGALYLGLSVLLGLFMVGLALGARLGTGVARRSPARSVAFAELFMIGVALTAAWVFSWGPTAPTAVLAFVPFIGAATGFAFPVYLAACERRGAARAIGAVTAADHVGAALGALVTGLVLIPWLGVCNVALGLAGMKVLTAGFVGLKDREKGPR